MPEIQLSQGTIEYRDQGTGPVLVLVHGALVNERLWDAMTAALPAEVRCIVPTLPLGSHRLPMNADADLTPPGVAALIAELIERLELEDVTLVGNDTGGALCQMVAAYHPGRLGRLVLTNCDAFEHFPPASFRPFVRILTLPGALAALDVGGRLRRTRSAAMNMMSLTTEPIPDSLVKEWMAPLRNRGVRRDLQKLLRAMKPEHTLAAAERLRGFDRPALLVWGLRDQFFPLTDAERLAQVLPKARLERIKGARTFVPMDAPDRLAELVTAFATEPAMA